MAKAVKRKARAEPRRPGYEGNMVIIGDVVQDPYDGSRLNVVRNIGGDPVEAMFARQQIDDAQRQAAIRFRAYHERAGAKGARAIDYTREHVDGGAAIDPLPEKQAEAAMRLAQAQRELGLGDYQLVTAIAGDGFRVEAVASSMGAASQRDREYFGRRFRDALSTLATLWGYAGRPATRPVDTSGKSP